MVLRGIVASLGFYVLAGALLFGAAGRWSVPEFWVWLAFMAASSIAILPILARLSPGLIEERLEPGPGDRDRLGVSAGVAVMLLTLAIAGLDAGRFHWSGPVPPWVTGLAWAGLAGGYWIVGWAMAVNRYFSSAVRIQFDRGQVLVSAGPYAHVRHPGYAGGLLFVVTTGLALGSWWATLPALPAVVWIVRRTVLEDAMLRDELDGYAAYARRVRFRILPGVW